MKTMLSKGALLVVFFLFAGPTVAKSKVVDSVTIKAQLKLDSKRQQWELWGDNSKNDKAVAFECIVLVETTLESKKVESEKIIIGPLYPHGSAMLGRSSPGERWIRILKLSTGSMPTRETRHMRKPSN